MPKVQTFDHEKGGHSRRGRRTSTSLAEINVVPLVDVMLVLLIIFMVSILIVSFGFVFYRLPLLRARELGDIIDVVVNDPHETAGVAAVPPESSVGAASSTITLAPLSRAASAAQHAALPAPILAVNV